MAYPSLLSTLVNWMHANGASAEHLVGFVNHWSALRSFDPLPCPACYVSGEGGALHPRSVETDYMDMQCAECGRGYRNEVSPEMGNPSTRHEDSCAT